METIPCPHCEAPLKPAATFCLACDTPVVDTQGGGLSVAASAPVAPGRRPLFNAVAVLVLVLALAGAAYGSLHYVHARQAKAQAAAASDVRRSLTLLVRAEGGEAPACHKVATLMAGPAQRQRCLAIVGKDPGARLENVAVDRVRLASQAGKVRVRATVVDQRGSRPWDHTVDVVDQAGHWVLSWNGAPEV